jgi:hypothetical protein
LLVVSQDEKQDLPVSVTELRAESYSEDGDNIVISLRTEYSTNERKYSIPVECFRDLIIDLRRLKLTRPAQRGKSEPAESLLPEVSILSE